MTLARDSKSLAEMEKSLRGISQVEPANSIRAAQVKAANSIRAVQVETANSIRAALRLRRRICIRAAA